MTTVLDDNVHNIALEGTFDDCQAIVKALFNDADVPRRARRFPASIRSTGAGSSPRSSIISPPPPRSARRIARSISPCRPAISATSSPARRPGAWACPSASWSSPPTRTTSCGARSKRGATRSTASARPCRPSMDIQVSSNFERLVFESLGRDGAETGPADGLARPVRRLRPAGRRRSPPSAPALPPARPTRRRPAAAMKASFRRIGLSCRSAHGGRPLSSPASIVIRRAR